MPLPRLMAMSCNDLVRDDIEILSYVLGLGRGIRDIVVDTHDAAMKTSDRTLSLVGAGSRSPDCTLRSGAQMVAVGGKLTLGMDASPQAGHVSRRGTHWLFVSCRALIGLARIRRGYGLHAGKNPSGWRWVV